MASYALKRAAFPHISRPGTVAMLLLGTFADLDLFLSQSSPSNYLDWHRTYLHSLVSALLLTALASAVVLRLRPGQSTPQIRPLSLVFAILAAAALHLVLDLGQSLGIELLWPFTRRRFFLDWLPKPDLFIFAILLAAILLPGLAGLVTEEIGAKAKGPRGRVGAILGLAAMAVYIGARALLHANAIATLDARTYHGESARRLAAFPEGPWLFTWLGVVETERALAEVTVFLTPGSSFDPDSARMAHKPEPSEPLEAALRTATAHRFLVVARFPKASIERTPQGYRIELRAFPYGSWAAGSRVMAVIGSDASGKVLEESLAWDPAAERVWWR